MGSKGRVTVAGAGAVGLCSALALADAGFAVTVCSSPARRPASGVAAGMLAPVFEATLEPEGRNAIELLLAARNAWPEMEVRAGVPVDRSGAVAIGEDAWLEDLAGRLMQVGARPVELGRATLEQLAPTQLAPGLNRGLLMREDWRLDAAPALRTLRHAAEAAGVVFRAEPLTALPERELLVIAAGADRSLEALAPELAWLTPVRGQIIGFANEVRSGVTLRARDAYAVPSADGLKVGATMETGIDAAIVEPMTLTPLVQAAGRLFPHLAQATFTATAGVRAASPDGWPMVGFSASTGVILAVGLRRNGWLLAPLVAQIVAAYTIGADPGPFAERLDPRRFG